MRVLETPDSMNDSTGHPLAVPSVSVGIPAREMAEFLLPLRQSLRAAGMVERALEVSSLDDGSRDAREMSTRLQAGPDGGKIGIGVNIVRKCSAAVQKRKATAS